MATVDRGVARLHVHGAGDRFRLYSLPFVVPAAAGGVRSRWARARSKRRGRCGPGSSTPSGASPRDGAPRLRDRHGSRLRAHAGRVRRRAHGGWQHPPSDARAVDRHLRPRRGAGVRRGARPGRRAAGLLVHRSPRSLHLQSAHAGGTPRDGNPPKTHAWSGASNLRRGSFHLHAQVDVPAAGVTAVFGPSGLRQDDALALLERARARAPGATRASARKFGKTNRAGSSFLCTGGPVGVVFQEPRLFPHLDVRGNLLYGWKRTPPGARPHRPRACRRRAGHRSAPRPPAPGVVGR